MERSITQQGRFGFLHVLAFCSRSRCELGTRKTPSSFDDLPPDTRTSYTTFFNVVLIPAIQVYESWSSVSKPFGDQKSEDDVRVVEETD
jgi:hypothetical protein